MNERKEKRGNITLITYDYDLTKEQLVRLHLMFYCWVNGTELNAGEMNICILLGLVGKMPITDFVKLCVKHNIYSGEDSTRNAIGVLSRGKQMIMKERIGSSQKKNIFLSPDINLSTELNTLLNIRCFYGDRSTIEIV